MTRLGMDVDVVEGLGRQLKGQAHQLQGVVTQIESLVNQSSTAWDGRTRRISGSGGSGSINRSWSPSNR